jgi:hypothetical protein
VWTHGFIGSATVSNRSSSLLVCARITSRGEGSEVAADMEGPPKGLWSGPRLYPAVPLIAIVTMSSEERKCERRSESCARARNGTSSRGGRKEERSGSQERKNDGGEASSFL